MRRVETRLPKEPVILPPRVHTQQLTAEGRAPNAGGSRAAPPHILRKTMLRLKIRLGSSRTSRGGVIETQKPNPRVFARSRASVSSPSSARAQDSRASPPKTLPRGRVSPSAPPNLTPQAREPIYTLRLRVRRSVAEPGPERKRQRTARARRLSLASLSRESCSVSRVCLLKERDEFERVGATSHNRSSVRARPRGKIAHRPREPVVSLSLSRVPLSFNTGKQQKTYKKTNPSKKHCSG